MNKGNAHRWIGGALLAILALACSDDGPLAPDGASDAMLRFDQGAAPPKQVPIRGAESFAPVPGGPTILCSPSVAGLQVPQTYFTSGFFTHLGRTSGVLAIDECELVTAAGPLVSHGHAIRTTSNGDQIFGSFQETIDLATGADMGQASFTGGTGRFTGATGSGTFVGMVDLASGEGGAFEFTGTISTVGSSD